MGFFHELAETSSAYPTPAAYAVGSVLPASATPQPPEHSRLTNPNPFTQPGAKTGGGSHSILQIERPELHDGKLGQFASDGVLTMAVEQGGWLNFALPSAVNNNSRLPRYMSW